MRRLYIFSILLTLALQGFSADYDKMWKKVEAARNKDLPGDVADILGDIAEEACREGNCDEMLAAQTLRLKTVAEVTPDSLLPHLARLMAAALKAEKAMTAKGNVAAQQNEKKAVEAAMSFAVIAPWMDEMAGTGRQEMFRDSLRKISDATTAYPATASECYDRALQHPDILAAAKAERFKRIINKGKDDSIFENDILSVIGHQAKRHMMLKDFYDKNGNRRAACAELYLEARNRTTQGDEMQTTRKKRMIAEQMKVYDGVPETTLLAYAYYLLTENDSDVSTATRYSYLKNALRRYEPLCRMHGCEKYVNLLKTKIDRLTQPMFNLNIADGIYLKDIRNIGKISITLQPLTIDGTTEYDPENAKTRETLKKFYDGTPVSITRDYDIPDWLTHNDTLQMPELKHRVYLVTAKADGMTCHTMLYNSDLAALTLPLPDDKLRIVVVSKTTGKPVPFANIRLTRYNGSRNNDTIIETTKADKKGETVCSRDKKSSRIYIWTEDDKAFKADYLSKYFYTQNTKERRAVLTVFTDRAAYKPGDTVKGNVVAHNSADENDIRPATQRTLRLAINDTDGKCVATDTVCTDENGNAPFEMIIPRGGKNGFFTVRCNADNSRPAAVSIVVEEYRKPTFMLTCTDGKKLQDIILVKDRTYGTALTDTMAARYDSVSVTFDARTYTDIPVAGANVRYSIDRTSLWPWWRGRWQQDRRSIVKDAVAKTDNNGKVTISIPLLLPEDGRGTYRFAVNVSVTDAAGETHEAQATARAALEKYHNSPTTAQQPAPPAFEVSSDEFPNDKTGVVFTMRYADGNTDEDVMPIDDGGEQCLADAGTKGPDRRFTAFYTLMTDKKVVESGACNVDSVYTRTFSYDSKYGEGLTIAYAWMKNGRIHSYTKTLRKPKPELRLYTAWRTFRNRSLPGAKETWTLTVSQKKADIAKMAATDAMPKGSRLSKTKDKGEGLTMTATVYDKRLETVSPLKWYFNVLHNNYFVSTHWNANISPAAWCHAVQEMRVLPDGDLTLAATDPLFLPNRHFYGMRQVFVRGTKNMMAARAVMSEAVMETDAVAEEMKMEMPAAKGKMPDESGKAAGAEDMTTDLTGIVRTELGETAFFSPCLSAADDGTITLSFTMPQSMTTWRMYGFIHDRRMRHCFVDTTCVVKKDLMVVPSIPRFLRDGDKTVIRTTVTNTTAQLMKAKVTLQIEPTNNANTAKETSRTVVIPADTTVTVAFDGIRADACDSAWVVRIAAMAENGSADGEQHVIPIINNKERVTKTLAFTLHGASTLQKDMTQLLMKASTDRRLTIRYTPKAEQLIADAITEAANPKSDDALSVAAAVYTNALLHLNDTAGMEKRLTEMMLDNGMMPWWKGMDGSVYITTAVARLMARLAGNGCATAATDIILKKAMPPLFAHMRKEVAEMRRRQKEAKKKYLPAPSATLTDILYICALMKQNGEMPETDMQTKGDIDYLVSLLARQQNTASIYTKANTAIIFNAFGEKKKAAEYVKSMMQYSVCTEEAGRYFDTPRAAYSWRNYRIPTVVAAIEAVNAVMPDNTPYVEEMQKWLLHEKRTQAWDNSANTADAIHAFFINRRKAGQDNTADAKLFIDNTPVPAEGNGMTETCVPYDNQKTFTVEKTSGGTAWGAICVSQTVDTDDITADGTGFFIKREIIAGGKTLDDGKGDITAGGKGNAPETGQRVTVRITVLAARDYDFVRIEDNRPACLEPAEKNSGFCHVNTLNAAAGSRSACYRSVGNATTTFYIDRLAKGTHMIDTTYYIDRQGEYKRGTAKVCCTYADEYRAICR